MNYAIKEFTPTQIGKEALQEQKSEFNKFRQDILECLPEGREKSIVASKLEEASMYATKSLLSKPENHF